MKTVPLVLALFGFTLPVLAETGAVPQKPSRASASMSVSAAPEIAPVENGGPEIAGRSIVRLTDDAIIHGRPCKRGWLRLHPNGMPSSFTTAREIVIGKLQIPADTWVMQNEKGVVLACAFPQDREVQGILCRGTGGAKGVQVALHPNGALKQVFLARDTFVQGVPCAANIFSGSVEFYEDGRLKSCKLSEPYTIGGVAYKKGARVELPSDRVGSVASN